MALAVKRRPAALQRRLRTFLYFIQWMPLLRYGRPFTALAPQQRQRFLLYLENHPIKMIRVGFWGLRTLVFMGYYGRAAGAQAIGYRADPAGWEALESDG